MGIFQLRYLDRIPPHAAVGESVELVKRGWQTQRRWIRQRGPAQSKSRPREVARCGHRTEPSTLAAQTLAGSLWARSSLHHGARRA
ncbi:MAG: transcription antitermination factor NusB [Acidobacteriota bacterium]